ncbi:hypothetical protein ACFL96_11485 [Thermoproteota archaeon]
MMRKRRHSGLSYILSVVMMTLVTASLASVVLLWGIGQVNESQSNYGLAIDARKDKAQERLVIENVEFNATGINETRIFVRNVGKVQIVIDQVYVNHTILNLQNKVVLGVQKSDFVTATFISPENLSPGIYYIIVSTSRGTTYADYYEN